MVATIRISMEEKMHPIHFCPDCEELWKRCYCGTPDEPKMKELKKMIERFVEHICEKAEKEKGS